MLTPATKYQWKATALDEDLIMIKTNPAGIKTSSSVFGVVSCSIHMPFHYHTLTC